MNFSHFEYLKEKDHHLSECIKSCIEAERYARINPKQTAISARKATESLFQKLSRDHHVKPANLSASIEQNCKLLVTNNEAVRARADEIRKKGNDAVHPREIAEVEAATRENTEKSMNIVRSLYELLCLIYGKPDNHDFVAREVPFGEYHVDRKIHLLNEGSSENYFVHTLIPYPRYFYLQSLSFGTELLLQARREEADYRFYSSGFDGSSHLLLGNAEIALPESSDRKIILYNVNKDDKLLSELTEPMPLLEALLITLDLIEALEDLKSLGIHHRNIYPGSILIRKFERGNRKGYRRGYLLNLQNSKVIDSDFTINTALFASRSANTYLPIIPEGTGPDWEKVDVHALLRVFLYCLHPQLAMTNNTEDFSNYLRFAFPNNLINTYQDLFLSNRQCDSMPSLSKIKEEFELAYEDALYC